VIKSTGSYAERIAHDLPTVVAAELWLAAYAQELGIEIYQESEGIFKEA
jgi:hypothetical protein